MRKEYEGLQRKEVSQEGWIKYDRFGCEGLSEVLAFRFSQLLSTRLSFCEYRPIKTDKGTGCISKSVISDKEKLVSLYSFFPEEPQNLNAIQLFDYYIPYIIKITELQDFGEWLTELFLFDMLIENEDRNPGNILLIANEGKYRYAPVMDNANSLGYRDTNPQFSGTKLAKPLMMRHHEQAKLFSEAYPTKIQITNEKLLISDLFDFYKEEDIKRACTLLRNNVESYCNRKLVFC